MLANAQPAPLDNLVLYLTAFSAAFLAALWLSLVFWAMRRPRYLHMAVTLAIYGYHFRKVFSSGKLA